MLLGAALGGVPAAVASVSFQRTDVALPAAPDSVAIGDLDGVHGKDIVVGLWSPGSIGVMLNHGDGTFAAMQTYTAGAACAGLAEDVTLGDVTQPSPGNRLVPDGKLDAYVACTPNVVRLTGDGAGALGNPEPINLNLPPYLGSATIDFLTLMRRPDGNPAPLLVLQHGVGSFGRELCISYEFEPGAELVCNDAPVEGPLVVGDLNGSVAGVPPDEVLTAEAGDKLGIFGFAPRSRWPGPTARAPRPAAVESLALGDLDSDADLDVVVGRPVNSLAARVDSIHYFKLCPSGSGGLEQVPTALPSTPGVDAVAVADVDGDACNDVVAGGGYGTGMVHLGDGAGGFDGGRDLPQLGYQNAATATRVSMAVDDLTGDGHPDVVIADKGNSAVMVYRNTSTRSGAACFDAPPTARNDVARVRENAAATTIDVLANDTDPDGGPKLVASVTQPAHGSAAIGGGGVRYKPAANYCNDLGGSRDTFTYKLNGGSSATVTVTVECVDDAPPAGGGPRRLPASAAASPASATPHLHQPRDDAVHRRDAGRRRAGRQQRPRRAQRPRRGRLPVRARSDDRLTGGTGEDLLDGSSGDDRMNGDAGDGQAPRPGAATTTSPRARARTRSRPRAATTRSSPATRSATRSTAAAASTRSRPTAPTRSTTAST